MSDAKKMRPKMTPEAKKSWGSEVVDSIYNTFEDQARKGNLGTFSQQSMGRQDKKKKRFFDD